jgi:hypothetical protein
MFGIWRSWQHTAFDALVQPAQAQGTCVSGIPFGFRLFVLKKWRILFFLSLAFIGIAPATHLAFLHSTAAAATFIGNGYF